MKDRGSWQFFVAFSKNFHSHKNWKQVLNFRNYLDNTIFKVTTYSLEQISETGTLNSILILHHVELDLNSSIIEIESCNPKLKQKKKQSDDVLQNPHLGYEETKRLCLVVVQKNY